MIVKTWLKPGFDYKSNSVDGPTHVTTPISASFPLVIQSSISDSGCYFWWELVLVNRIIIKNRMIYNNMSTGGNFRRLSEWSVIIWFLDVLLYGERLEFCTHFTTRKSNRLEPKNSKVRFWSKINIII